MATQGPKQKDAKKDAKPAKPKKVLTEEEKRTRTLLGIMIGLAVITSLIYIPPYIFPPAQPTYSAAPVAQPTSIIPNAGGKNTPPAEPGKPPAPGTPGTPSGAGAPAGAGASPPAGGPGGVTPGGAAAAATPAASPAPGAPPMVQYRPDPFVEYTLKSDAEPTPTPRPAIELPPADDSMPPVEVSDDVKKREDAIVGLPIPYIPRLDSVDRSAAVPAPPRAGAGSQDVQPAYNKRLSGVIIGDGVRALLEVNDGQEIVTRVVQPGDEVDGIQVLSIGQVTEGNHTVTRMIIMENGVEQSVDLKAAPPQTTTPGAGAPGAAPAAQ